MSENGTQLGDHEAFKRIVSARRSIRHFSDKPIPPGILEEILRLTQRSPSGYNLQPWIAVVVTDPKQKKKLKYAAFNQVQIEEAPATVIFAADLRLAKQLDPVAESSVKAGHWSEGYSKRVKNLVRVQFRLGPLNLIGYIRALSFAFLRLFRPVPMAPTGRTWITGYVWKQAALAAQTFMLAAAAHGLDTCPMEGIDEVWVRKIVGLPRHFTVPLIIPVGYRSGPTKPSARLAPDHVFFRERYEGEPFKV
jgi:nitroreductase